MPSHKNKFSKKTTNDKVTTDEIAKEKKKADELRQEKAEERMKEKERKLQEEKKRLEIEREKADIKNQENLLKEREELEKKRKKIEEKEKIENEKIQKEKEKQEEIEKLRSEEEIKKTNEREKNSKSKKILDEYFNQFISELNELTQSLKLHDVSSSSTKKQKTLQKPLDPYYFVNLKDMMRYHLNQIPELAFIIPSLFGLSDYFNEKSLAIQPIDTITNLLNNGMEISSDDLIQLFSRKEKRFAIISTILKIKPDLLDHKLFSKIILNSLIPCQEKPIDHIKKFIDSINHDKKNSLFNTFLINCIKDIVYLKINPYTVSDIKMRKRIANLKSEEINISSLNYLISNLLQFDFALTIEDKDLSEILDLQIIASKEKSNVPESNKEEIMPSIHKERIDKILILVNDLSDNNRKAINALYTKQNSERLDINSIEDATAPNASPFI